MFFETTKTCIFCIEAATNPVKLTGRYVHLTSIMSLNRLLEDSAINAAIKIIYRQTDEDETKFLQWQYLTPNKPNITLHLVHSRKEFHSLLQNINHMDAAPFVAGVHDTLNRFRGGQWSLLGVSYHNMLVLEEFFGSISTYMI
jgi:hypothetical protein